MVEDLFRIENLSMSFGDKKILKNINLVIHRGEIFALMGPSGAGKTTLLRILNFFEKPAGGDLFFEGTRLSHVREINTVRQRMSLLFQTPTVFNTSVFNNVAYGLKVRKMDRTAIEKKVRDALALVGLQGKERQKARTLSGGEAQRMAFARAIVYDPEILFLDEPTTNLDPANVAKIEEIIMQVRDEKRTTIVLATHNIPQVKRIANRVGLLLNGELIEVSSKDQIFNSPSDARASAFIKGDMVY